MRISDWSSDVCSSDLPEILATYQKLGIPLEEQKVLAGGEGARKLAVDAVFDSVSVATTFRKELAEAGVIFLSISEAIREYPELRSEEHTSELQSLMRNSYAVFSFTKQNHKSKHT